MKKSLTFLFTVVLALGARSQVSPPDAVIDGKTIPEWTADWWKWIYSQPTNASALFDRDGSHATNGQPAGSVFFVANIATPGSVTRSFTVLEGKYLLFPVRYVTLDNVAFASPLSVAELRDAAAGVVDLMTNLHATIDSQAVDVPSHRVLSPVFGYNFPDANNLDSLLNGLDVTGLVDPIVSDGFWIMLNPLPIGTHIINFGGEIGPPYNSSKQVTAYITVIPTNQPPAMVLPNDAVVGGLTIGEWNAEWWKWILPIPVSQNPALDNDGSRANLGQPSGSVFFLSKGYNITQRGARTFSMPQGKYLFVPLLTTFLDNVDNAVPLSLAEMKNFVAAEVSLITALHATIDGVAVPDLFSHRAMTPFFAINFTAPDSLYSSGRTDPFLGLDDPMVADGYCLMVAPLTSGTHVINFGGTVGPPVNATFDMTDTITVVPGNHPPIADASATTTRVISPDNHNARVVLDGSRSVDLDNDDLASLWAEGSSNFATGTVAIARLSVGVHQISLIVSDGSLSATNTITLHVITPVQAVRELAVRVRNASMPSKYKHPLVDPLEDASEAFHRGHFAKGRKQSREFQEEVREHVAERYPAIASELVQSAQEIIDAVGLPSATNSPVVVLPNDAIVGEKSLSDWTADFLKWTWLWPTNTNPSFDTDGRWATNGQPDGPVFFVTLAWEGMESRIRITRRFSVPEDKYLFFPMLTIYAENIDTVPPWTVQQLRDAAAGVLDSVTNLHATIDNTAVPDLFQHRLISPVYNYVLPDANNLKTFFNGHPITGLIDPEVNDGYWLMVEPLPPGVHVINFGVNTGLPSPGSVDITDIITIVPIPLPKRVEDLISIVTTSGAPLKRQHELLGELHEAAKDFQAEKLHDGIEELEEFQKKVRHEVGPIDQALAEQLIDAAQKVIDKARAQSP